MAVRTSLLRGGGGEARVSTVELFFDLVFVFAITQLSHRLLHHPGARGVAESAILVLAIWSTWIMTAWVTNWLDPARVRVRFLLFAMMAAGLVVSMSIPDAFGARAMPFALAYAAMEIGRTLFTLAAMRGHDPANYRSFQRILVWQVAMAALWVAGAFAGEGLRFCLWTAATLLWLMAAALSYYVPGLGRSDAHDWHVYPAHLSERCGLFIIIALGESVLSTGATFADLAWTWPAAMAFAASFVGTIALWWTYFNVGAERAARVFERSAERGRIARLAYTYLHIPIVAGIILGAAAIQLVIGAPTGAPGTAAWRGVAGATLGGPILFLAGTAAFKRATGAPFWPLSHLAGIAALALLAFAAPWLEPYRLGLAVAAVLAGVALWETISLRGDTGQKPAEA